MNTRQQSIWSGKFGKEYTERNSFVKDNVFDFDEWNNLLYREMGITRTSLNELFFNNLDVDSVLEVGSNMGLQLNCFEKMGYFSKICGLEVQRHAISESKKIFPNAAYDIVQGIAEEIPFKDSSFDLLVTNGVLIHISPENLDKVLSEIHRCSKKYIFGCEYYDDNYTEINYRGHNGLLWRGDFCSEYLSRFPDLRVVKKKTFDGVQDKSTRYTAFLLEKIK